MDTVWYAGHYPKVLGPQRGQKNVAPAFKEDKRKKGVGKTDKLLQNHLFNSVLDLNPRCEAHRTLAWVGHNPGFYL